MFNRGRELEKSGVAQVLREVGAEATPIDEGEFSSHDDSGSTSQYRWRFEISGGAIREVAVAYRYDSDGGTYQPVDYSATLVIEYVVPDPRVVPATPSVKIQPEVRPGVDSIVRAHWGGYPMRLVDRLNSDDHLNAVLSADWNEMDMDIARDVGCWILRRTKASRNVESGISKQDFFSLLHWEPAHRIAEHLLAMPLGGARQ